MEEIKLVYYPNSVKEARLKGYDKYFTGKPCNKGHYALRRTNDRSCIDCQRIATRTNKKRRWHENKDNPEYKESVYKHNREWNKRNKDYYDKYREDNKETLLAKERERRQWPHRKLSEKEYRNRPEVRLALNLRGRLYQAIKRGYKAGSAVRDLGCSIEDFITYIESKFQESMSWKNYGLYGWHIDHITPLSSFDLTDREQFLQACHYTNLQPLWAKDNLSKSNKIL